MIETAEQTNSRLHFWEVPMFTGTDAARAILKPPKPAAAKRKWRLFRCDGVWHVASPRLAILSFGSGEVALRFLQERLTNAAPMTGSLFGGLR
jgi:hypothetical protein